MYLPRLEKVTVRYLSLFPSKLDRAFFKGINMIVGGNGVGKTTFISSILHAMFGGLTFSLQNEQSGKLEQVRVLPDGFFRGRLEPEDMERAEVELLFQIGKTSVTICRSLANDTIRTITASGDLPKALKDAIIASKSNAMLLDSLYVDLLEHLTGIKTPDLAFIVSALLVFDESRRTLLWQSDNQNRLLRLLFLQPDLDHQIRKLEEEVTTHDTTGRHRSERRRELNKLLSQLRATQSPNLSSTSESDAATFVALEKQYERYEAEIPKLEQLLERLNIEYAESTVKLNQVTIDIQKVQDSLESLQKTFFKSAYSDSTPSHLLILHSLIVDGKCLMCDSQSEDLRELGESLRKQAQCVVCRTTITKHLEEDTNHTVGQINRLEAELKELQAKEQALSKLTTQLLDQIRRETAELSRSQTNRLRCEQELSLARHAGGKDVRADTLFERTEREILQLDQLVADSYKKRDKSTALLRTLNRQVAQLYEQINTVLSPTFSEYGSRFLGMPCDLVVAQTKGKKPRVTMHPRFNAKERRNPTEVSESQRFFLDQAFRMALITWFHSQSKYPVLYLVETPEGSLDIAYEKNVADMYILFSKYDHTIVLTSNLNSSRFLRGIYASLPSTTDRLARTLDLIQIAQLSQVQRDPENQRAFNEVLAELQLPLLESGTTVG